MEQIILPESWKTWQIIRPLGEGAYGSVYLAEKKIGTDASRSAIKVIQISPKEQEVLNMTFELGSSLSVRKYYEDMVLSYIQEIKAMIALKGHPNIVYIEDYAVDEDPDNVRWMIYIRMEYLIPFTEYIQTHPLTESDVIRLGVDLCSALCACEKNKILHRDIKPSNILVSETTGQFKLGDFGVARTLEQTGNIYSAKGTFPYMAPEIFNNKPCDHRADLYSTGLVLYHLLNRNREPFVDLDKQIIYARDREAAMAHRMSGEKLPAPVEASREMSEVILKACDPDPSQRYADADEFRTALEALHSTSEIGSKHRNRRRIHPAISIGIPILLAILIGSVWTDKSQTVTDPGAIPVLTENAPEETEPLLISVDIGNVGIVPIMEGKQLYFHPKTGSCVRVPINKVHDELEKVGCVFTEEEQVIFDTHLKKQFTPGGNGKIVKNAELSEGDTVTLTYAPDQAFDDMLSQKGYRLLFEDQTFVVTKGNESSRLHFVRKEP